MVQIHGIFSKHDFSPHIFNETVSIRNLEVKPENISTKFFKYILHDFNLARSKIRLIHNDFQMFPKEDFYFKYEKNSFF